MAHSTALTRLFDSSKNCHLQYYFSIWPFSATVPWLLVRTNLGLYPLLSHLVNTSSNASTIAVSVIFLMGFCKDIVIIVIIGNEKILVAIDQDGREHSGCIHV